MNHEQNKPPQPCPENWDNMENEGTNKHCLSCQKTVHDFSQMSDADILHFFKQKANKNICGRFRKEQINRELITPPKFIFKPMALLFPTLLFLGVNQSLAQNQSITKKDSIHQNSTQENIILITGMVKEKTSAEPIPLANVVLKGTRRGTTTDFDGNFTLTLPIDKLEENDSVSFQYFGYKEVTIPLTAENINHLVIELEETNEMLLGEVEIEMYTLGKIKLVDPKPDSVKNPKSGK